MGAGRSENKHKSFSKEVKFTYPAVQWNNSATNSPTIDLVTCSYISPPCRSESLSPRPETLSLLAKEVPILMVQSPLKRKDEDPVLHQPKQHSSRRPSTISFLLL